MKIFKYLLEPKDEQKLVVQGLCKVLSVAEQNGNIVVYIVIDESDKHKYSTMFRIHGTGHDTGDHILNWKFMGTINLADGKLMFHVFWNETIEYEKTN